LSSINRQALVPYSPEQMFALVDDINAYSQFLPWCASSEELSRNGDEVEASVEIAKGGIKKAFTTLNRSQGKEEIEMTLVKGPFKHLHGYWRFRSLKDGEACKISLDLDYDFSNKLIALAIGPVFHTVADSLVDAFVKRAKQHYGDQKTGSSI